MAPRPGCRARTILNSTPFTGPPATRRQISLEISPWRQSLHGVRFGDQSRHGELKWYFQFTPHDLYDYDANETPVLVDVEESGATRHLLVQANRNGFLYVLDRTNGKFISAAPFVEKLNWAKRC